MDQKLMDHATAVYNDLTDKIMDSCKLYKDALKLNEYDPRITLNQFDVLLQYSLLKTALIDYELHIDEIRFISRLCKYFDFCNYLDLQGYKFEGHRITWADLAAIRIGDLARVLNECREGYYQFNFECYKNNCPDNTALITDNSNKCETSLKDKI